MSAKSRTARCACAALFSLLLASLTAPQGAVAAPAAAPGDGTYSYTITRNGAKVGDSTVTVRRNATSITVHEVESFSAITDTVDASLDLTNLSPTSYSSSFPLNAEIGVTAHLSFYSGGARETVDGTTGATDFRLENGTSKLVVVDGAMMTGFLFLPAQIRAQSLSTFTALAPSAADTYKCRLEGGSNFTRPELVPAADASIVVDGSSNSANVQFVEWYDPQSMTVDEVDVPTHQVTIIRKRGTT